MVLDSFTRLSGRESKPGPCLLHTYQRPTGWECLHNVKRQRLEGSAALSAAIYRGPLSAGLGTKLQKKQEERGKQKGIGVRTVSPSRLQPYSQHCRWPVHLCHFLFLQQLPSSLLDPGRSRKAEKSPRFQVSGSEKLQIRCEKHSLRARAGAGFSSHRFVLRFGRHVLAPPWERENTGANLNPSQPCQSSHLKKRLLCFTSELPNRQSWPPAYAQQQQSWLIAHLSTVHTSSCNAMESRQPHPKDRLCHPRAADIHNCLVPSQQEQIPGLISRGSGLCPAWENHTANITCLVFLTAAERRL